MSNGKVSCILIRLLGGSVDLGLRMKQVVPRDKTDTDSAETLLFAPPSCADDTCDLTTAKLSFHIIVKPKQCRIAPPMVIVVHLLN